MSQRDLNRRTGMWMPSLAALSRPDLVLAAIPSAFLAALLVTQFAPVSVRTALVSASAVGALALIDALFLNPPRGPDRRRPST